MKKYNLRGLLVLNRKRFQFTAVRKRDKTRLRLVRNGKTNVYFILQYHNVTVLCLD